ncbi:jouberin [Lepeophtheirus salmonis]|uniref:jouberin n=1 Tax=Lepeophtheirus salmonis TaxID=72036 RepID=UPI001AEB8BC2|nr:jouberin-like [Lepeophtheirus salmonis]
MELDLIKERSEKDLLTYSKNSISIIEKEKKSPTEIAPIESKPKKRKKKKKESISSDLRIQNKLGESSKKNKNTNGEGSEEHEMKILSDKDKRDTNPEQNTKVLGVVIHHTECLKMDFLILHPVVKVYVVDLSTGKLIKKSDTKRKVTSYYEGEHVQSIVPCMTQPFEFRKRNSLVPRWEEVILFNESYNHLKSYGPNIVLFFMIQDFVSMTTANNKSSGWHHIAWAFLKLFPSNDRCNIGNKVRLQLYKPPKKKKSNSNYDDSSSSDGIQTIWKWWNKIPRMPYSSSLFVTVQSVEPPIQEENSSVLRSLAPHQKEIGLSRIESNPEIRTKEFSWTRLPGQSCKIPKNIVKELMEISACLCLDISADGHWLAMASVSSNVYVINIYDTISFELQWTVKGHLGYIYQLHWNGSSTRILSASGDGTVRIWSDSVEKHCLEHPAYVYSARYHPSLDLVATGGFDQVVRIWSELKETGYIVIKELLGHTDFITALEFDIDGQVLFSGDNVGYIRVWESVEGNEKWNKKKFFELPDLKDCPINDLKIHPGGRRLLIHSRSISNALIMIDIKLGSIMQKYIGSQSFQGSSRTRSHVTPCGTYIFAGSQDGATYVWNTDTGQRVFVYTQPFPSIKVSVPVGAISYHPHDHIMVISSPKAGVPVVIYKDDSSEDCKSRQITNHPKNEEFDSILQKLDGYLQIKE